MNPFVTAANVMLTAFLIAQGLLAHPAAAFAHAHRQWWPGPLPAATLTTADGTRQPLIPKDGKGTLLVLGTTRCGSTCSDTMTLLQRVFQAAPDLAVHWQVRFVSIAAGSDDPVAAGCFSTYFDGRFLGGTCSPEDTHRLVKALHFTTWHVRLPSGAPALRHAPRIEVIDPQGRWTATYQGRPAVQALVDDLHAWQRLHGPRRPILTPSSQA